MLLPLPRLLKTQHGESRMAFMRQDNPPPPSSSKIEHAKVVRALGRVEIVLLTCYLQSQNSAGEYQGVDLASMFAKYVLQ